MIEIEEKENLVRKREKGWDSFHCKIQQDAICLAISGYF